MSLHHRISTVVVLHNTLENDVVTEGDSVEICLVLFNKEMITGTASVTLITNDTQTNLNSNGENRKKTP